MAPVSPRRHPPCRQHTWLLEQAEEFNIVRITVEETGESAFEEPLKAKYPHLQRVFIVTGPKVERLEQYQAFFLNRAAQIAAEYFDELVQAQEQKGTRPFRVLMTGGETWLEFANLVKDRPRKNLYIHVAALVGRGRFAARPCISTPSSTPASCGAIQAEKRATASTRLYRRTTYQHLGRKRGKPLVVSLKH